MQQWAGLLGLVVFLAIAFLLSSDRRKISLRILFWGLGLQLIFAVAVIGIPRLGFDGPLHFLFEAMNDAVVGLLKFSDEGSKFLFGKLASDESNMGFIFGFRVLPTIIFFSTLVAIFYHLGVLQRVVRSLAWVMRKFLPIGGAESLSTAANIFLGQTEAPLMIKPYLARMSRSELLCIMIGGMANAAGGVLAAYVALLHSRFPDIAGHLITVSFMSAPATILISKIMMPDELKASRSHEMKLPEKIDSNILEAATRGASEGLMLALNVGAMLIAFIALVYVVNAFVGGIGAWFGLELSLQQILGWLFAPVAWLLGVPGGEIISVGQLLGEKIALNEFVFYISLSEQAAQLSDRSVLIASYALCGFANFSSIGIQVGGIGAMAPERRGDLAKLGLKALIGGNLATFSSAALVSLLV